MAAPETAPRITITNAHLALLLASWAVFGQLRDAISSWVLAKEKQAAVYKQVENTLADVSALQKLTMEQGTMISKLEGNLKAEISRSYETDQNLQRTLEQMGRKPADSAAGKIIP